MSAIAAMCNKHIIYNCYRIFTKHEAIIECRMILFIYEELIKTREESKQWVMQFSQQEN